MARARKAGESDAGAEREETGEVEETPEAFGLLQFLNQPIPAEEMAAALDVSDEHALKAELEAILARREEAGGMLESAALLGDVLSPSRRAELAAAIGRLKPRGEPVAPERAQFKSFLLQNPNYFGNLESQRLQADARSSQGEHHLRADGLRGP